MSKTIRELTAANYEPTPEWLAAHDELEAANAAVHPQAPAMTDSEYKRVNAAIVRVDQECRDQECRDQECRRQIAAAGK